MCLKSPQCFGVKNKRNKLKQPRKAQGVNDGQTVTQSDRHTNRWIAVLTLCQQTHKEIKRQKTG